MKQRILTGDNTTGKLHLGHFVGSLENRVALQDTYETFIILADMHAFAYPKYLDKPRIISESVYEVLLDNLAVGIDPQKVTFFRESAIPEIYELGAIFSMLVSSARALRNPTIKEEIQTKQLGDNYSLGFIFFPLLQAADILSMGADIVPVGEDQLPHIEQTNEIVKKFHSLYGKSALHEVKGKVGRINRLVGIDGKNKMTKSLDNGIYLSDSPDIVKQKVMRMYTDPQRIHATDPGKVEGNPVFIYLDAFGTKDDRSMIETYKASYQQGKVGDVEVKQYLSKVLNAFLDPIRERHNQYASQQSVLQDILKHGEEKARLQARETLEAVKKTMGLV